MDYRSILRNRKMIANRCKISLKFDDIVDFMSCVDKKDRCNIERVLCENFCDIVNENGDIEFLESFISEG